MRRRELTDFGVAVKKRLVEVGKTQRQLAKEIGIRDVYLNVIIHGERSGEKYIDEIARRLDIDASGYTHMVRKSM